LLTAPATIAPLIVATSIISGVAIYFPPFYYPKTIAIAIALPTVAAPPAAYVFISEAGICLVVVPSITIIASASATVIDDVDFAEPSNKLSSAAVDPTLVPPISKVVTDISPATVNRPSATVIKSVSSVCPIVVPLIKTLSISNDPPLINPVVVIVDEPVSIVPNPEVIEPESNAPVVTILELPAITL
jgi:hypothetical protein